jgi:hypothetical protein
MRPLQCGGEVRLQGRPGLLAGRPGQTDEGVLIILPQNGLCSLERPTIRKNREPVGSLFAFIYASLLCIVYNKLWFQKILAPRLCFLATIDELF